MTQLGVPGAGSGAADLKPSSKHRKENLHLAIAKGDQRSCTSVRAKPNKNLHYDATETSAVEGCSNITLRTNKVRVEVCTADKHNDTMQGSKIISCKLYF